MRLFNRLQDSQGDHVVQKFIVYGVGHLESCIVFPRHIDYQDAIDKNDLTGIVKYMGTAQFVIINGHKNISVKSAKKPNSPIAYTDCSSEEINFLTLNLSILWADTSTQSKKVILN